MKKSILFLLPAVLVLAACSKSAVHPPVEQTNAELSGVVLYGGDPYADGVGYYIRMDSTHETLSPQNLPAEYKHSNVNAHVAIRYFDTGSTLQLGNAPPNAVGPRIVVLKSIRNL